MNILILSQLQSSLIFIFLSHTISNPLTNYFCFIFRIYLEFNYFSSLPQTPPCFKYHHQSSLLRFPCFHFYSPRAIIIKYMLKHVSPLLTTIQWRLLSLRVEAEVFTETLSDLVCASQLLNIPSRFLLLLYSQTLPSSPPPLMKQVCSCLRAFADCCCWHCQ